MKAKHLAWLVLAMIVVAMPVLLRLDKTVTAPANRHADVSEMPGRDAATWFDARPSAVPSTAPNQARPRRGLEMQIVRQWAEREPRAAADWVAKIPPGAAREEAITHVAIVWANQDLPPAIEWAHQFPQGDERHSAVTSIAYEAARTEPVTALNLALELPPNNLRDDLITHAAAQWAATDPQAACAWAKQIIDAVLREHVLSAVATVWGESDPVAAAELAVASLPPGREQDDAVVGIVQRWVQVEPEAAADWVDRFPDGAMREVAVENLEKLWPTDVQP